MLLQLLLLHFGYFSVLYSFQVRTSCKFQWIYRVYRIPWTSLGPFAVCLVFIRFYFVAPRWFPQRLANFSSIPRGMLVKYIFEPLFCFITPFGTEYMQTLQVINWNCKRFNSFAKILKIEWNHSAHPLIVQSVILWMYLQPEIEWPSFPPFFLCGQRRGSKRKFSSALIYFSLLCG